MKKKLIFSCFALLSLASLAACSSAKEAKEATTPASSTVASSSTATKDLKESAVTYLSDQEIEAVQTLGDYKNAFKALGDAYVKDFDDLIAQVPAEAQTALEPYRKQVADSLEQQQELLNQQFAAAGDDSTPIPAESKDMMIQSLKQARDMLQETMKTARDQAKTMLN